MTLLSLVFGSGGNAKPASGVQSLAVAPHHGETISNPLMHQGIIDVSTIDSSGYTLDPKRVGTLLETPRKVLLRNANDPRLKDAINTLYRPGAKVSSGSTADAVRFERATGELLSPKGHTQKLIDRRTQLMKLRKDPNLGAGDQRIIHDILKDIQNALSN